MSKTKQQVVEEQPTNINDPLPPDASGGNGSGDPIGIECDVEVEGGASLKVLLKLNGVAYASFQCIVYPDDSDTLDNANFSAAPMHALRLGASSGADVHFETLVPRVSGSFNYRILVAAFDNNADAKNHGHKVISVLPVRELNRVTFDALPRE